MRFLIILSVVLMTACGSATKEVCEINPEAILSWSEFGQLEQRPLPYTEIYEGCDKRLLYVAADHGNDPQSATYALISSAFEKYDISHAIAEGFPSEYGSSPASMVEYAKEVNATPRDAEPYFMIRQAVLEGAGFQGGEPSDAQVLAGAQDKGLSASDIFAYYILRQIPQLKRQELISDHQDPRLASHIESYSAQFAMDTNIEPSEIAPVTNLKGFKAWYEETNGLKYDAHFKDQDVWPTSAGDSRETNRISDIVANIRDRFIISEIAKAVEAHDTVLVVYGGSHHLIHEPALVAAFGEAVE